MGLIETAVSAGHQFVQDRTGTRPDGGDRRPGVIVSQSWGFVQHEN